MKDENFEIHSRTQESAMAFPIAGTTFSCQELLGIIKGDLIGHYWTRIDTNEIVSEGTLETDDTDTFNRFSRNFLSQPANHDCQYGGQVSEEQARSLYRAELWKVWQNLYK